MFSCVLLEYAQLFAALIARTAKDVDVLIDSLPSEESTAALQVCLYKTVWLATWMCIFIQANCIGANMGGTSVFVKWHSKDLKEIISNNKIMLQIIFNQIHKKNCYL